MAVKKRKRVVKKKVSKKKAGRPKLTEAQKKTRAKSKRSVSRKSQTTGKAPTTRLRSRRKKNIETGYYPNPIKTMHYIIRTKDKYYFDGMAFVKTKTNAACWGSVSKALKIAQELADNTGLEIGIVKDIKKK